MVEYCEHSVVAYCEYSVVAYCEYSVVEYCEYSWSSTVSTRWSRTVSTRWSSTVSTRLGAAAHLHALLAPPACLPHARVMRARTVTLSAVQPQQLRHWSAHTAPARSCGTGPPRLVTPPTDRQPMRSAAQPTQRIRHGSTRCAGPQGQGRPGGSREGGHRRRRAQLHFDRILPCSRTRCTAAHAHTTRVLAAQGARAGPAGLDGK